jgi:hypothetical protein
VVEAIPLPSEERPSNRSAYFFANNREAICNAVDKRGLRRTPTQAEHQRVFSMRWGDLKARRKLLESDLQWLKRLRQNSGSG